jgi:hypothetical protein
MRVYDLIKQVSNPQNTTTEHIKLYSSMEDAFDAAISLTANNDEDDEWYMITYRVEERDVI